MSLCSSSAERLRLCPNLSPYQGTVGGQGIYKLPWQGPIKVGGMCLELVGRLEKKWISTEAFRHLCLFEQYAFLLLKHLMVPMGPCCKSNLEGRLLPSPGALSDFSFCFIAMQTSCLDFVAEETSRLQPALEMLHSFLGNRSKLPSI